MRAGKRDLGGGQWFCNLGGWNLCPEEKGAVTTN
jgi:hypothetical protein